MSQPVRSKLLLLNYNSRFLKKFLGCAGVLATLLCACFFTWSFFHSVDAERKSLVEFGYWKSRLFDGGFAPSIGVSYEDSHIRMLLGVKLNPEAVFAAMAPLAAYFEHHEATKEADVLSADAQELDHLNSAHALSITANVTPLGVFFDSLVSAWKNSFVQVDGLVWFADNALVSQTNELDFEDIGQYFAVQSSKKGFLDQQIFRYVSLLLYKMHFPTAVNVLPGFNVQGPLETKMPIYSTAFTFDRGFLENLSALLWETNLEKISGFLRDWLVEDDKAYEAQLELFWMKKGNILYFSNTLNSLDENEQSRLRFFDDFRFRRAAQLLDNADKVKNTKETFWFSSAKFLLDDFMLGINRFFGVSDYRVSGSVRFAKLQNSLLDAITLLQDAEAKAGDLPKHQAFEYFASPAGVQELLNLEDSIARLTEFCGSLTFKLRPLFASLFTKDTANAELYQLLLDLKYPNYSSYAVLGENFEAMLLREITQLPLVGAIFKDFSVADLRFQQQSEETLSVKMQLLWDKLKSEGRM